MAVKYGGKITIQQAQKIALGAIYVLHPLTKWGTISNELVWWEGS